MSNITVQSRTDTAMTQLQGFHGIPEHISRQHHGSPRDFKRLKKTSFRHNLNTDTSDPLGITTNTSVVFFSEHGQSAAFRKQGRPHSCHSHHRPSCTDMELPP